ncbi:MAG: Na/Pi cotransporter family protein [Clostridiales bacterium]|nr:Na/Pi cotransporter family protein [Candidatus Equinaster intestinalis]
MIAELAGGLAFFLYGMSVMSGGLEKMAGGKLERTLKKVTSSYIMSLLLGAGITIAIQSSSAMTVMLVGLVNSGIMEFSQTIGVIMGSNIGTTLTSWLLSLNGIGGENIILTVLKPTVFAPVLALIGIAMRMFSKDEKKHDIGTILVGFGILICGMDLMSASVASVKEMEGFNSLLTAFSNPILALLISTAFTGIIQSSAATVGIVQALALTGAITYEMAIPLVLGANIGTCMTALLASIGTSRNAKRVVSIHISIKLIGTAVFMVLLGIAGIAAPNLITGQVSIFGVAIIHTVFNITTMIIFLPFSKLLVWIAKHTVREKEDGKKTVFLDERLMNTPPMAIAECKRLTNEMAVMARDSIYRAIEVVALYDKEKDAAIETSEAMVDRYEDKLGTYLVELSRRELSDKDSREVGRLLHSIGDFERLSDHAVNILKVAREIYDKKIVFSKEAKDEISVITAAIIEILDMSVKSFENNDTETASKVEPLEQVIDGLNDELQARHIQRVQEGKCTIEFGFVLSDLLNNYERISDHCSNVAVYTVQRDQEKKDTHKYLNRIKNEENGQFAADFEKFASIYAFGE